MEAILLITLTIKFCFITTHVSPHCIKSRDGIEKKNCENTLQYSCQNRSESTISIKRNSSRQTISNHRGDFSSRIVYEIHLRTMRPAVCQNFFNHAAFSFEQRPGRWGFCYTRDFSRYLWQWEKSAFARKSFKIFQRPGKSFVLDQARRGYVREENPSHRVRQPHTCVSREWKRVNLHSSRISDTWLRAFESLRREMMIPVKTRKISWSYCLNIRTIFT